MHFSKDAKNFDPAKNVDFGRDGLLGQAVFPQGSRERPQPFSRSAGIFPDRRLIYLHKRVLLVIPTEIECAGFLQSCECS